MSQRLELPARPRPAGRAGGLRSLFGALLLASQCVAPGRCSAEEGLGYAGIPEMLAAALGEFHTNATGPEAPSVPTKDQLQGCVTSSAGHAFVQRWQGGLAKMLEKRRKAMRHGLGRLAKASSKLAEEAGGSCQGASGALHGFQKSAERLASFTESKTFIEYKALEKLVVGGHDIHKPLNKFIASWKKVSPNATEVGSALGAMLAILREDKGEPVEPKPSKEAPPAPAIPSILQIEAAEKAERKERRRLERERKDAAALAERVELERKLFGTNPALIMMQAARQTTTPMRPEIGQMIMEEDERRARNLAGECRGGKQHSGVNM